MKCWKLLRSHGAAGLPSLYFQLLELVHVTVFPWEHPLPPSDVKPCGEQRRGPEGRNTGTYQPEGQFQAQIP